MMRRQGFLTFMVAVSLIAVCAYTADAQGRRGGQRGAQGGQPGGGQPGQLGGGGQRPGGMMGGGMMGGGFGGGLTSLLGMEAVQKELELVEDQVKEIGSIDRRAMFAGMADLRDLPQEERMTKMREMMEESTKKLEAKIGEILLPHQMDRLKQIEMQQRLRGRGFLRDDTLKKELNITEAQSEKLLAKQEQIQEKVRKQMAELQKKAQDELLAELTPAQRAKIKALVGDPFEFPETTGRGGFGGRSGAPGGAPGAPGGGARRRPGGN